MIIMAGTVGGIRGWLQKVASGVEKEKAREATRMAESRFKFQRGNIAKRIVAYKFLEVSASELLVGDQVLLERKIYEICGLTSNPTRIEVLFREPDDLFREGSFVLNYRPVEKMAVERPEVVVWRMNEEELRQFLLHKLKGPNRPEDQLAQWAEQASYQFLSDKANAGENSKNPVLSDSLDPTFSNLLEKPAKSQPLEGPLTP
jgi:hypothetical protein